MRRCHFVKPNHASQTIQQAIFFDTETHFINDSRYTGTHKLNFGYASFTRRIKGGKWAVPKWCRFETVNEFWGFVQSHLVKKKRLYMFCHNTNFDLPVLDTFNQLSEMGVKIEMLVIEGPPTIIKGSINGCSIVILDTLNFWRMPLARLGELIGVPKLSMPINQDNIADYDIYCRRDVEIIMKAVQVWSDFLVSNDYGGFAYTLAGQAMKLYRHKYMTHDIGIHDNVAACNLERMAYMGGRTECFRIGTHKGPYYLLDVNSMYPYVMRKYNFPTMLRYHSTNKTVDDLKEIIKTNLVVAEVDLRTPEPTYAMRHHHKLIYPVGEFTTALCTPELLYAIDKGHIKKVKQLAIYRYGSIFRQYVDDLYQYRLKLKSVGDKIGQNQYKLLLNSLFGKWGQKGLVFEIIDDNRKPLANNWTEVDIDTGNVVKYRSLCGIIQKLSDETESRDSFPAIAAHVTAYARMELWGLINEAGRENVAYCDTDSILVTQCGYDRVSDLLHDTQLGRLKCEGCFDTITIYGCKDYCFGETSKTKGVKQSAIRVGKNKYIQQKWTSLLGQLRTSETNAPRTSTITKTMKRVYDKGVVTEDGNVVPLTFPLESESLE